MTSILGRKNANIANGHNTSNAKHGLRWGGGVENDNEKAVEHVQHLRWFFCFSCILMKRRGAVVTCIYDQVSQRFPECPATFVLKTKGSNVSFTVSRKR